MASAVGKAASPALRLLVGFPTRGGHERVAARTVLVDEEVRRGRVPAALPLAGPPERNLPLCGRKDGNQQTFNWQSDGDRWTTDSLKFGTI